MDGDITHDANSEQGQPMPSRGFAQRRAPSLADLCKIHGVCEWDRRRPGFSQWYRRAVLLGVSEFQAVSLLRAMQWRKLTGLNHRTCVKLRDGSDVLPRWQVVVALIAARVVDAYDGRPNLALARQLRPLTVRTYGRRPRPYVNWGVGDALLGWRRARGYTQGECFDVLGADSASKLSGWERGASLPGPNALARLVQLRVVDQATARAILDSDHYPTPVLAQATPEALRIIRG